MFGEHKGKEITDETIPIAYLRWLAESTTPPFVSDFEPPSVKKQKRDDWMDLISAAEDEIERRETQGIE